MIRTPFLIGVVLLSALLTGYVVGCVTIPATGPTPPTYYSSIRIVNLDPAVRGGGNIRIAYGPFDPAVLPTYSDLPFGVLGDASAGYATYFAGGKKLLVGGVDADTSAVTFNSDNQGTMYILPRKDIKADARFLIISERFTYAAASGIRDTTRVRFFNAIATFDTVNVRRAYLSGSGTPVDEVFLSALRFQKVSSFDMVPANATRKYYFTGTSGTAALNSDTISVTGAGFTDLYVMLYDSVGVLKATAYKAN
jgi:hypothetical protein